VIGLVTIILKPEPHERQLAIKVVYILFAPDSMAAYRSAHPRSGVGVEDQVPAITTST